MKILDVLDGLHEAHRLGVIHRDVKPSNCYLEAKERVKIGDFGLAKSLSEELNLTKRAKFVGTVLYASPEQLMNKPIDFRSDVYSLAATFYYLLTARAPHETNDMTEAIAKAASESPPPIRDSRPDISPELARVVEKGLERDIQRRWQSMEEFRQALMPFIPGSLTVGEMGLRFAAYLIDLGLFFPLNTLTQFHLIGIHSEFDIRTRAIAFFTNSILFTLYFILTEGLFGCSLGKQLLRLTVCDVKETRAPGLKKALVRTLGFGVCMLPFLVMEFAPTSPLMSLLYGVAMVASVGLVMSTMRTGNGFRGPYELLSGTRVIRLPQVKEPPSLPVSQEERTKREEASTTITRIGVFEVREELWKRGNKNLMMAEDTVLDRRVWILMRSAKDAELSERRRDLSRPTRQRWLASGTQDDSTWDAFSAPAGKSLCDVAHAEEFGISWRNARPIIDQLATELSIALEEQTLPDKLSLSQVYVTGNASVCLADWSHDDTENFEKSGEPEVRALELLRQSAAAMLKRNGGVDFDGTPKGIHLPVPLHASQILDRLFGNSTPYRHPKELALDLENTSDRPTEVDARMSITRIGMLSPFVFGTLFLMFFVSKAWSIRDAQDLRLTVRGARVLDGILGDPNLNMHINKIVGDEVVNQDEAVLRERLHQRMNNDLHLLQTRVRTLGLLRTELLVGQAPSLSTPLTISMTESNDLRAFLVRDGDAEHVFSRKAIEQTLRHVESPNQSMAPTSEFTRGSAASLGLAGLWVVSAFVFRGGLSFLVARIAMIDSRGKVAGRVRCAWRVFLLWGPVVFLFLMSAIIDAKTPHSFWLVIGTEWAAILTPVAYALVYFISPACSIHDRLAGTYLVPR